MKTIKCLVLIAISVSAQLQLEAQYANTNHLHPAKYLHENFDQSRAFKMGLPAQSRLDMLSTFDDWKESDFDLISYEWVPLGHQQSLELFLIRFDEDFVLVTCTFDGAKSEQSLYGISTREVFDHIDPLFQPFYHILPRASPNPEVSKKIVDAINRSSRLGTMNPILELEREMIEANDPPPIIQARAGILRNDDSIFSMVSPEGEASFLTARRVTEQISIWTYFQESNLAPMVYVFTIFQENEKCFILNRGIMVGSEILVYFDNERVERIDSP